MRPLLVKMWKDAHELPGYVAQSLASIIHQNPATGWVRANRVANEDVLSEINELRKANEQLRKTLSDLAPQPSVITSKPANGDQVKTGQ